MKDDKVERYDHNLSCYGMSEDDEGKYVKHTDYVALEAGHARTKDANIKNFNQALKLACENARLKAMLAEVVNSDALREALEVNDEG